METEIPISSTRICSDMADNDNDTLHCNVDKGWQQRPHGMPPLKTNTTEQISYKYVSPPSKYHTNINISPESKYHTRSNINIYHRHNQLDPSI